MTRPAIPCGSHEAEGTPLQFYLARAIGPYLKPKEARISRRGCVVPTNPSKARRGGQVVHSGQMLKTDEDE